MLFDPLSINTAVYAVLMAFTLNIALCPIIIPHLTRLKVGQNVRSDGPQSHLSKKGTPTMGGVMILLSFFVVALLFLRDNTDGLVLLFVTLGFGAIGFCDDYIKVVKRRSLGLRAWQKLLGQFAVGVVLLAYILLMRGDDMPTAVLVPFTDGMMIDLAFLYIPFFFLALGGTVNGVNLTDGLDGLAAGVTLLVTTFFALAAWAAGSPVTAIAAGAAGSLLGFLLYNAHPARVFMGDTGSLALGGFIAALALLLRMPLFIPIVGIIYVIETLSVMIQVGYFKLTKQRFFKMAPIHHSFELSGWSETKIVTLFYVTTAIACLIGFLAAQRLF
ncbi:MAG: phospho-N-acetylmuramoyl-pentapeptide-transferase [Defluviitaleaceae bacterium]|nr:phospho-N-acetylmuramoyl-pentapeptide-transferase [Defluviitaleaceae bacterium]